MTILELLSYQTIPFDIPKIKIQMIAFVMDIANDGNEEAQLVLAKYFLTNECTDEQNTQAIAWLKELAANGNEDAQDILEDLE